MKLCWFYCFVLIAWYKSQRSNSTVHELANRTVTSCPGITYSCTFDIYLSLLVEMAASCAALQTAETTDNKSHSWTWRPQNRRQRHPSYLPTHHHPGTLIERTHTTPKLLHPMKVRSDFSTKERPLLARSRHHPHSSFCDRLAPSGTISFTVFASTLCWSVFEENVCYKISYSILFIHFPHIRVDDVCHPGDTAGDFISQARSHFQWKHHVSLLLNTKTLRCARKDLWWPLRGCVEINILLLCS